MAYMRENLKKWEGIMSRETWKQLRDQYKLEDKKGFSEQDRIKLQIEVGKTYNCSLRMEEAGANLYRRRKMLTYLYALEDDAKTHEIDTEAVKSEQGIEDLFEKYPRK